MRRVRVSLFSLISAIALLGFEPVALAAASPTVDTFEDTFDGSCADGDCSLRDAVSSVDPGGTVRLPAGFFALNRTGAGPDAGDIDLDRPVTIVGIGEGGTFLDASGLGDRVFDVTADATIRHVTLLNGGPVGTGGLIRIREGNLALERVTTFQGIAGDGGSIAVGEGASASIDRSWIFASLASDRGGGLFVRGDATLLRSTISDDRAEGGGGGIYVAPVGSVSFSNSTLSNNIAVRGGGIRALGDIGLISATVAANEADVGGGILASETSVSSVTNSVFARNRASDYGPLCGRRLSSDGHNVADVRGCGFTGPGDIAGVNPELGVLRQNGGPTPTHALHEASPAIGRGGVCLSFDQRGAPRTDCDSGAYELVFCLDRPVTIVGTPGDDDLSGGLQRDVFLGLGGDDFFQGSLDVDRACGGKGNDRLIGGPGDDQLTGFRGRDVLLGESGDDLLIGGPGTDICRGGDGHDTTRRCETVS
ncbi:MAG: choice-of-anchor Q domain-containing protein [Actinomycetota bacterium]